MKKDEDNIKTDDANLRNSMFHLSNHKPTNFKSIHLKLFQ